MIIEVATVQARAEDIDKLATTMWSAIMQDCLRQGCNGGIRVLRGIGHLLGHGGIKANGL